MRLIRQLFDRSTHRARHAAAVELIHRVPTRSVLFVCHGNLCRSPYAAARLHSLLRAAEGTRIDSAGFAAPNRAPPAAAIAVAAARGLDLSRHRSQVVSRARLDAADLVVVMEPGQLAAVTARGASGRRVVVLGDLDPDAAEPRDIEDPFDRPREVFEVCYGRIDRCVAELHRVLTSPS